MKTVTSSRALSVMAFMVMFSCKNSTLTPAADTDSETFGAIASSGESFNGTYFVGSQFACEDVNPLMRRAPADGNYLAITEGVTDLGGGHKVAFSCADKMHPLDYSHPPWDKDHWLATKFKSPQELDAFFTQFTTRYPDSRAFKKKGNVWWYNQPDCTVGLRASYINVNGQQKQYKICGLKVNVKVVSYVENGTLITPTNSQLPGVIYDACPEHHYNNAIKDAKEHPDNYYKMEGFGNPCKVNRKSLTDPGTGRLINWGNNADINGDMWDKLKLNRQKSGKVILGVTALENPITDVFYQE